MKNDIQHPSIVREHISPIIWGLLIAVILEAGLLVSGGLYLEHRRTLTDQRAETERQGICGILSHLPRGIESLDAARHDFRCPVVILPKVIDTPSPQPPKRHHHKQKTSPRHTPPPRPTVILTPQLVPMPGPTVTVTKHAHRSPARSPRMPHRPKPGSSPRCVSVLGQCFATPPPIPLTD